jgi:hypothetical protein
MSDSIDVNDMINMNRYQFDLISETYMELSKVKEKVK